MINRDEIIYHTYGESFCRIEIVIRHGETTAGWYIYDDIPGPNKPEYHTTSTEAYFYGYKKQISQSAALRSDLDKLVGEVQEMIDEAIEEHEDEAGEFDIESIYSAIDHHVDAFSFEPVSVIDEEQYEECIELDGLRPNMTEDDIDKYIADYYATIDSCLIIGNFKGYVQEQTSLLFADSKGVIKALVERSDKSQKQICEEMGGKHPTFMTLYIKGKRTPGIELLTKIAFICGYEIISNYQGKGWMLLRPL